eukprot:15463660-Alexandrium_andersonii.AAC.1
MFRAQCGGRRSACPQLGATAGATKCGRFRPACSVPCAAADVINASAPSADNHTKRALESSG